MNCKMNRWKYHFGYPCLFFLYSSSLKFKKIKTSYLFKDGHLERCDKHKYKKKLIIDQISEKKSINIAS